MIQPSSTAHYRVVPDGRGNRYLFYCQVSGALACTTDKAYRAKDSEQELQLAWSEEGRKNFCRCGKCGRWVIDAMFNVEVLECVECAPFEAEANYCKSCGEKVEASGNHCPACGKPLTYFGKEI